MLGFNVYSLPVIRWPPNRWIKNAGYWRLLVVHNPPNKIRINPYTMGRSPANSPLDGWSQGLALLYAGREMREDAEVPCGDRLAHLEVQICSNPSAPSLILILGLFRVFPRFFQTTWILPWVFPCFPVIFPWISRPRPPHRMPRRRSCAQRWSRTAVRWSSRRASCGMIAGWSLRRRSWLILWWFSGKHTKKRWKITSFHGKTRYKWWFSIDFP